LFPPIVKKKKKLIKSPYTKGERVPMRLPLAALMDRREFVQLKKRGRFD